MSAPAPAVSYRGVFLSPPVTDSEPHVTFTTDAVWIAKPASWDDDMVAQAAQDSLGRADGSAREYARLLIEAFGYKLSRDESLAIEDLKARALPAPLSKRALVLQAKPDHTGIATDLLRAPGTFAARRGGAAVQPMLAGWREVGTYLGAPVYTLSPLGPLTVKDMRTMGYLTRRYAACGYPGDGRVPVNQIEGALQAGYGAKGGRDSIGGGACALFRESLERLKFTGWRHRHDVNGERGTARWSFLDYVWTQEERDESGTDDAYVTLSEDAQTMIHEGRFTFLESPAFNRIADRDELAARLWSFLGTHEQHAYPYAIFNAPVGAPPRERAVPAIADLLGMNYGRRRDARARLRQACKVIEEEDSRYHFTIERAAHEPKDNEMWNLHVAKCTTGRATGALRVAHRCTTGRAGDGKIPAQDPESVSPSSSPVKRYQSKSSKATGFQGNPDEEQAQGNDRAAGEEQERSLGMVAEPPCTPAVIVERVRFGTDTQAELEDLIGPNLLEDLAAMVCAKFRDASGGQVCCVNAAGYDPVTHNGNAASRDDAGAIDWCPAQDAFRGVVLKVSNYLEKRGQVKGSPAQYVVACMKHAAADPRDMMGRTRAESVAAYREMTALHPHNAIRRALADEEPAEAATAPVPKLKRIT